MPIMYLLPTDKKPFPPAAQGVEHYLKTTRLPVIAGFRPLDADNLAAAKKIFNNWEVAGIVRSSSSAWSSPLHLFKKKDSSWRPCSNFRLLNLVTSADEYPVSNMGDFTGQSEGCSIFSKLDLKNRYLQVPIHCSAVPICRHHPVWALWSKEHRHVIPETDGHGHGWHSIVSVYIDNILVASPDLPIYIEHLQEVLKCLKDAGLVLNIAKCKFVKSSVDFQGRHISASGSTPLVDKMAAISSYPLTNTVCKLQQFRGVINFYRKFIPTAAR